MLALREAGIPIGGFKYPIQIFNEHGVKMDGGYMHAPNPKTYQDNPTGFWEYSSVMADGLQRQHTDYDGEVVKVLTKSLTKCHHDLVKNVIVIMRHPRKVLSSRIKCGELSADNTDMIKLHALSYLNNMVLGFYWLRNTMKSFKLVVYEELLSDPEKVLCDLCDWLERGSHEWGAQAVKRELNRSPGIDLVDPILDELEEFYYRFVNRDIEAFYKYDMKDFERRLTAMYADMAKKNNVGKS